MFRTSVHGFSPPLILDETEARRAEKNFLRDRALPYVRVWMTRPPTSLKVWIWHC